MIFHLLTYSQTLAADACKPKWTSPMLPLLQQNYSLPLQSLYDIQNPVFELSADPAKAAAVQAVTLKDSVQYQSINPISYDLSSQFNNGKVLGGGIFQQGNSYYLGYSLLQYETVWRPQPFHKINASDGDTCNSIALLDSLVVACYSPSTKLTTVTQKSSVGESFITIPNQQPVLKTDLRYLSLNTGQYVIIAQHFGNSQSLSLGKAGNQFSLIFQSLQMNFQEIKTFEQQIYMLEAGTVKVYQVEESNLVLVRDYILQGQAYYQFAIIDSQRILAAGEKSLVIFNANGQIIDQTAFTIKAVQLSASKRIVLIRTASYIVVYLLSQFKFSVLRLQDTKSIAIISSVDTITIVKQSTSQIWKIAPPAIQIISPSQNFTFSVNIKSTECEKSTVNVVKVDRQKVFLFRNEVSSQPVRGREIIDKTFFSSGPQIKLEAKGDHIKSQQRAFQPFTLSGSVVNNLLRADHYPVSQNIFIRVSSNSSFAKFQKCYEIGRTCEQKNRLHLTSPIVYSSLSFDGQLFAYILEEFPNTLNTFSLTKNCQVVYKFLYNFQAIQGVAWLANNKLAVLQKLISKIIIIKVDQFADPKFLFNIDCVFPFRTDLIFDPIDIQTTAKHPQMLFVKLPASMAVFLLGMKSALHLYTIQNQQIETFNDQWSVIVGESRVSFLNPNSLIVHQLLYGQQLIKYDLKQTNLAKPYVFTNPSGSDNLYVLSSQGTIVNFRLNLNEHSISSHILKVNLAGAATTSLFSAKLNGDSAVGVISSGKISYLQDFSVQGIEISTKGDLTNFINQEKFEITATNDNSEAHVEQEATIFNYELNISSSYKPDTLSLNRTNVSLNLNDSQWFNGSRLNYQLSCPQCKENIKIVQHIQPWLKMDLSPLLIYHPPGQPLVWIVTTEQVIQMDRQGNFLRNILTLPSGVQTCTAAFKNAAQQIGVLACQSQAYNWVFVFSFQAQNPVLISKKVLFARVQQVSFKSGYVMALVKYPDSPSSIMMTGLEENSTVAVVSSAAFDKNSQIVDFMVIGGNQKGYALVLLQNYGLGLVNLQFSDSIIIQTNDALQLTGTVPDSLSQFVTTTNRFIKMEMTDFYFYGNASQVRHQLILLLVSQQSAHVKIKISISSKGVLPDNYVMGFQNATSLVQAYNRYGQQKVLNKIFRGCSINCKCQQNNFFLAYTEGSRITYALYDYGGKMLQEIKGGLQHQLQSGQPMFTPFADKFVYVNEDGLVICNVSNNITLQVFNVSSDVLSQALTVTAASLFSKSNFTLTVEFSKQESKTLFIVMLVVVVLLVLLMVGGSVMWKIKERRQKNKETLIEESQDL